MYFELAPAIGTALTVAATAYACVALYVVLAGRHRAAPRSFRAAEGSALPPVTVLKPLCGAEPGLYENLRTFCLQHHPAFQLLCGVRQMDDPAIAVVGRLQAEFPLVDLQLVVNGRIYGTNYKVSNLLNLLPAARYEHLVIADSDIAVAADYLTRVTAPLTDPTVGVVTCLYRGVPRAGRWSHCGAWFIDDWFAPSVKVAAACGSTRFCFGATIAVRREALDAAGGLAALNDVLADDFWLGEFTRRQGLRTVLSDVVVSTDVVDDRFSQLWAHEVRWLRTIRGVAPLGFAFTAITFTFPLLLLGLALARTEECLAMAGVGAAARIALHYLQRRNGGPVPFYAAWAIPVRDGLSLLLWAAAQLGSQVVWRDEILDVTDPLHSVQLKGNTKPF